MDDREVLEPDERSDLQKQFTDWNRDCDSHWGQWRKEARECFDIFAGRSWSKEDRAAMDELNRVPVEFNRTAPLIKAVVGAEIAGRLRVDYKPRTAGDAQTNELLTSGAEWIRDECDAEGEESQAFMNSLICGMGWTETRLDFEVEEDGQIIEDVVDSLEVDVDPASRKSCCDDARYIRRRRKFTMQAARERFGDQPFTKDPDDGGENVTDPLNYYEGDDSQMDKPGRDEVVVTEFQWYDLESEYLVLNPSTGQTMTVGEDQFTQLQEAAAEVQRDFQHTKRRRRVYRRAFLTGTQIIEVEDLPAQEFTYKCITGDYDRNAGVWFGLVRSMRDPQKWANKFFSQILHILSSNAKGGLMVEEGAVENIQELEESWAAADSISIFTDGALQDKKVVPKPPAEYPMGIDRLMQVAQDSIRDVAGVNPEFLGQADREQAGVLEHQRKQAAYGIMGTFFDALRRFRKYQGRLMLKLMRFLPQGTLIRVSMDDWENPQYVPMEQLALDLESTRFDVIVDEAPSGPNQKERTFAIMMQLLPMVKEQMTPELWLEVLRFSPLPEAVVEKIQKSMANQQADPMVEMMKQVQAQDAQLTLQGKQLENAERQARTEQTQVETAVTAMNPDPRPQVVS